MPNARRESVRVLKPARDSSRDLANLVYSVGHAFRLLLSPCYVLSNVTSTHYLNGYIEVYTRVLVLYMPNHTTVQTYVETFILIL